MSCITIKTPTSLVDYDREEITVLEQTWRFSIPCCCYNHIRIMRVAYRAAVLGVCFAILQGGVSNLQGTIR